eukprot:SAG11_NODE_588_length_8329_cov_18.642857_5_plen_95_part_00
MLSSVNACHTIGLLWRRRSGLLSRREFYRCVRRYVSSADMTDNDVAQLCRMVDGDGSGEISIDEFEVRPQNTPLIATSHVTRATALRNVSMKHF